MKKKSIYNTGFWLLTVIVWIDFQPCAALAQSGGFTITPLVKRGDPSPGGGRFLDCNDCTGDIDGTHALNNQGEVAFFAEVRGVNCLTGLFLVSAQAIVQVVDPCQQTPLGRLDNLAYASLNDSGQIVLSVNAGLVLYSQGQFTKIVFGGDPTPIGTVFRGCPFSAPSINNQGDVVFGGCNDDAQGLLFDGIFSFSSAQLNRVVISGDPSPVGGTLGLNFLPAVTGIINNNGDVLFHASAVFGPLIKDHLGLFVTTKAAVRKIVTDGDPMPNGTIVFPGSLGIGDLNDKGEVVFTVKLQGNADTGIFLKSGATTRKIIAQGDPTPIGGTFSTLEDPELIDFWLFVRPHINNQSAVAFKAKVKDSNGERIGLFLASPKAALKVIAVGDHLPGGQIRRLTSFALNDLGQVAFFAYGKKDYTKPLGLYLATPVAPTITAIKLKRKQGALELRVNGAAMITGDTVIEINGVALDVTIYPADFREDGGTTTQVVSRDARLESLIQAGQAVQITVYNGLTNRRSEFKAFVR